MVTPHAQAPGRFGGCLGDVRGRREEVEIPLQEGSVGSPGKAGELGDSAEQGLLRGTSRRGHATKVGD